MIVPGSIWLCIFTRINYAKENAKIVFLLSLNPVDKCAMICMFVNIVW